MFQMNRRSFLLGTLTVAATAAIPAIAGVNYPVLYADGIHDDYPAMQAMIDGFPVMCEGEIILPDNNPRG